MFIRRAEETRWIVQDGAGGATRQGAVTARVESSGKANRGRAAEPSELGELCVQPKLAALGNS